MMRKIAIFLIKFYQIGLRPFLTLSCRFEPCCSEYALAALERYGLVKGLFLAGKRICRCHPLHQGGWDPVK